MVSFILLALSSSSKTASIKLVSSGLSRKSASFFTGKSCSKSISPPLAGFNFHKARRMLDLPDSFMPTSVVTSSQLIHPLSLTDRKSFTLKRLSFICHHLFQISYFKAPMRIRNLCSPYDSSFWMIIPQHTICFNQWRRCSNTLYSCNLQIYRTVLGQHRTEKEVRDSPKNSIIKL